MDDTSYAQASARFGRWGRRNAQFLAVTLSTAAAGLGMAYALGKLKEELRQEQKLRQTAIDKAFAEGQTYTLERVLAEKNNIVQLAFAEEYRKSRGQGD